MRIGMEMVGALGLAAVLLAPVACEQKQGGQQPGSQQARQGSSGSESGSMAKQPGQPGQPSDTTASAQQPGSQGATSGQSAAGSSAAGQPSGASTSAGADTATPKTVTGQVVSASASEVVVKPEAGQPELKLKVGSDTSVTIGGQQGTVSDLKEGTQVRASYQEKGGEPQAIKIEAQSAGGKQSAPAGKQP